MQAEAAWFSHFRTTWHFSRPETVQTRWQPWKVSHWTERGQREAPPGAIFTKFREAIAKDRRPGAQHCLGGERLVYKGCLSCCSRCIARLHAGARDVALYFVHWLTDLVGRPARSAPAGSALSGPGSQAGAEPTPLGGCEKFVIKFPLHASPPIGLQTCSRRTRQSRCNRHVDSNRSRSPRLAKVLNSFLQSFKLIEGITSSTETQAGRTCPSRHTVVFLALRPPTSAFAQASKQQNPAQLLCRPVSVLPQRWPRLVRSPFTSPPAQHFLLSGIFLRSIEWMSRAASSSPAFRIPHDRTSHELPNSNPWLYPLIGTLLKD